MTGMFFCLEELHRYLLVLLENYHIFIGFIALYSKILGLRCLWHSMYSKILRQSSCSCYVSVYVSVGWCAAYLEEKKMPNTVVYGTLIFINFVPIYTHRHKHTRTQFPSGRFPNQLITRETEVKWRMCWGAAESNAMKSVAVPAALHASQCRHCVSIDINYLL